MKSIFIKSAMMLAALTLMWGCSSSSDKDDDEEEVIVNPPFTGTNPWQTVKVPPTWIIDWKANDQRPDWQEPVPSKYESWMIVQIQTPTVIAKDASDDDLMAIFIDDEVRGLSSKATTVTGGNEEDKNIFILKVFGNPKTDNNKSIVIKYYCSKLNHIFTVNGESVFTSEGDLGVAQDFFPPFLLGASKYPVVMYTLINFTIDQEKEDVFVPNPDDMVAAFVDDECRGYTTIGDHLFNGRTTLTVYSKSEGETVKIRYYSVNKGAVREFDTTVETKSGSRMTQISI